MFAAVPFPLRFAAAYLRWGREIEAKLARESAQRRLKYLKAYEKEHRGPPINYAEVMRERELLKAEALKREEEFQSNLKVRLGLLP